MRLLVGAGPDIDLATVEPASFEIERPVMRGPRLHDHVMRFPQALAAALRGPVGGLRFIGNAADKAAFEPSL